MEKSYNFQCQNDGSKPQAIVSISISKERYWWVECGSAAGPVLAGLLFRPWITAGPLQKSFLRPCRCFSVLFKVHWKYIAVTGWRFSLLKITWGNSSPITGVPRRMRRCIAVRPATIKLKVRQALSNCITRDCRITESLLRERRSVYERLLPSLIYSKGSVMVCYDRTNDRYCLKFVVLTSYLLFR